MKKNGKKVLHQDILVKGIVQGVGFRPFIYKLARTHSIKGKVLNSTQGVIIEAEGNEKNIRQFLESLKKHPPVLAEIHTIDIRQGSPVGYKSFQIMHSTHENLKEALMPPDVRTCEACKDDIFNPSDRHYHYPFTNCTNCGPRFTIIKDIPYDRKNTSMNMFKMCKKCSEEYHNPYDRRFHAQPVACPVCGPHVSLLDRYGNEVANEKQWLEKSWNILEEGKILAVKGIGGFHIACDPGNSKTLKILRERKGRQAKPFAVMCGDLDTVKKYCHVSKKEEELLISPAAPIVILTRKKNYSLPYELAPDINTMGVMLPYSPLHYLLLSGPFDMLVMTSGNYRDLPLVIENREALQELGGIADYFLIHNREIVNRCDDSLVQLVDRNAQFFRRSRGYVPQALTITREDSAPVILGVGGEMKNSFCLLKNNQAFMSQYIGEIDTVEGERNLFNNLINFQNLVDAVPDIVAYDAHPHYASALIAKKIPSDRYVRVYHHHAHLASCMADNNLANAPVIGVILDGTGYGTDGHLWGFEILTGNYFDFKRGIHLAYVPLPGGEMAIKEPWRTAAAYLTVFLGDEGKKYVDLFFGQYNTKAVEQMIVRGFNTPLSCGCGRLFDAVSALSGICLENTYEGQAAIELAELVRKNQHKTSLTPYSYTIEKNIIMPEKIISGIIVDKLNNVPLQIISERFHLTLIKIICESVQRVSSETGINMVVLSGGTWHNTYLFTRTKDALQKMDFDIFYHRKVPPNDGGIALGQAIVAHWRWKKNKLEET